MGQIFDEGLGGIYKSGIAFAIQNLCDISETKQSRAKVYRMPRNSCHRSIPNILVLFAYTSYRLVTNLVT